MSEYYYQIINLYQKNDVINGENCYNILFRTKNNINRKKFNKCQDIDNLFLFLDNDEINQFNKLFDIIIHNESKYPISLCSSIIGNQKYYCIEWGPRLNFRTPWCSNAIDILHKSGINMVIRIELSYITTDIITYQDNYDKMTQMQYPEPLKIVDLL